MICPWWFYYFLSCQEDKLIKHKRCCSSFPAAICVFVRVAVCYSEDWTRVKDGATQESSLPATEIQEKLAAFWWGSGCWGHSKCVCACACMFVRVRVCACVCARVRVCVCVCSPPVVIKQYKNTKSELAATKDTFIFLINHFCEVDITPRCILVQAPSW